MGALAGIFSIADDVGMLGAINASNQEAEMFQTALALEQNRHAKHMAVANAMKDNANQIH